MRAEETEKCLAQPLVQKVTSKSFSHLSVVHHQGGRDNHYSVVDVSLGDPEVFFMTCLQSFGF